METGALNLSQQDRDIWSALFFPPNILFRFRGKKGWTFCKEACSQSKKKKKNLQILFLVFAAEKRMPLLCASCHNKNVRCTCVQGKEPSHAGGAFWIHASSRPILAWLGTKAWLRTTTGVSNWQVQCTVVQSFQRHALSTTNRSSTHPLSNGSYSAQPLVPPA